jgi:hypothetical protein
MMMVLLMSKCSTRRALHANCSAKMTPGGPSMNLHVCAHQFQFAHANHSCRLNSSRDATSLSLRLVHNTCMCLSCIYASTCMCVHVFIHVTGGQQVRYSHAVLMQVNYYLVTASKKPSPQACLRCEQRVTEETMSMPQVRT